LILTSTNHVIQQIEKFDFYWNRKDLNSMASLLSDDIHYILPPFKVGPIVLAGRDLTGKYHVLKFFKDLFHKFHLPSDYIEIIKATPKNVNFILGFSQLGFVTHCEIGINDEGAICLMSFSKVTDITNAKELGFLPVILRTARYKAKSLFTKTN
jgi:hypothetical protein